MLSWAVAARSHATSRRSRSSALQRALTWRADDAGRPQFEERRNPVTAAALRACSRRGRSSRDSSVRAAPNRARRTSCLLLRTRRLPAVGSVPLALVRLRCRSLLTFAVRWRSVRDTWAVGEHRALRGGRIVFPTTTRPRFKPLRPLGELPLLSARRLRPRWEVCSRSRSPCCRRCIVARRRTDCCAVDVAAGT